MEKKIKKGNLKIASNLYDFIEKDVLAPLKIETNYFWEGFEKIIYKFSPLNKTLLNKRDKLKKLIDEFYIENKNKEIKIDFYKDFLKKIGYIIPEGNDFKIVTQNIDDEIAKIPGPQLVVPVTNARYALNAANARWGSLYDALYGSDFFPKDNNKNRSNEYDPIRGKKVIDFGRKFLDKHFPLVNGSHHDVINYEVENHVLTVTFDDEQRSSLLHKEKYIGFSQDDKAKSILLKNNNLHVEIVIDSSKLVGSNDKANINDIILESAITTIQDCEDSVATVDADDKILAYKNWMGLMKGDLEETFKKNGNHIKRSLNKDKKFFTSAGEISLSSLSLMLVRNVGHLMTNSAILFKDDEEVPEGIMDGVVTSLIALFDVKKYHNNSKKGSIYIVKPKMHGPDEVKFTNDLFGAIEDLLSLDKFTIKIGIMDEERRTTVNLKECIREAKNRLFFINTGFLDRTGDEIHTAMEAGPIIPKQEIKNADWIDSYEKNNVQIGLLCGLSGKAQIGKGMWAMPDLMHDMYKQKINHPQNGANTAWVPSPTAATIHALHYHEVDVFKVQESLITNKDVTGHLNSILNIPIAHGLNWSNSLIENEVFNNAQGILGYVVRWVNQGVGCSKVPDINDVGLMEDRATCRISSQHLANWLHHNIISENQLINAMKKMAKVVDEQNSKDKDYTPMSPNFENSVAFQAAIDLILEGRKSPSGYTEPILHERRLIFKSLIK